MFGDHCARHAPTHGPDRVIARQPHGGLAQPVGEDLTTPQAQRPDEGVVVVDVAVQGRLSDAKAVQGHPCQGDCVQPVRSRPAAAARVHHLTGVQGSVDS